ncbi:MAG: cytochrome c/FTR1 family iron permease [Gemmatimonadaceae bacterium]
MIRKWQSLRKWAIIALLAGSLATPPAASGQDSGARRLANIVSVAVSEYGMAVGARGVVISAQEYDETTGFLQDARGVAAKLTGTRGADSRAALSTIIAAVGLRRPPSAVAPLHQHLIAILGEEGMVELPSAPLDTMAGHQLFTQNCAACHGTRALGDGPQAHGLSTAAPAIGSAPSTPQLTPSLAYDVVSVGVRGTAMQAFGASLSAQQRWNVINYVYTLRGQQMVLPNNGTPHESPGATAARIIALLNRTRSGHDESNSASDAAFDAYLAFEPLETIVRAKDPGLVASLESSFATFKAAVRGGDVASTDTAYNAIVRAMPRVVALASETTATAAATFWQSFLIILREGFEAILVVGAVVAVLIKTGNRKRLRSIWLGAILGVIASLITAIIIKTTFSAIPASSEIVEAVSLLIAVVVLFSVSYWLISKVEAVKWQRFITGKVSTALERGGGGALMLVAFLAVYREGAETALFYQALFSQSSGSALPLILGIVAGSIALGIVFILFYRFGIKIPMRPFFAITSLLLYYMAFVFAGRGIRELQEGNAIPITPLSHIPNIPWLGLFPTVETVAIQGALLVLFAVALLKTFAIRADRAA